MFQRHPRSDFPPTELLEVLLLRRWCLKFEVFILGHTHTHTHTQICHFFSLFYGTYACRHKTETPVNGTNLPCTLTDQSGLLLAVTNKKPTQASITKVKQFEGSTSFVRRSQWMLEQLRQVNGIDPNRVSELSSAEPRCPSLTVASHGG